jgi:hypothetical protein
MANTTTRRRAEVRAPSTAGIRLRIKPKQHGYEQQQGRLQRQGCQLQLNRRFYYKQAVKTGFFLKDFGQTNGNEQQHHCNE